ncbi:MAG TPA: hypothetical protein VJP77_08620, partial [Planctomycetota bacterium]|nr:hypothetical protein [Planctomycetota bacterium]
AGVGPAVAASRERAIANAAPLIEALEGYRARHGRYPTSLLALHGDVDPGVVGVERYRYEPSGDAYNLVFEQPALDLATQELVVYNPRDEHVATGHALDLLEFTGRDLELRRGHYAEHAARQPHWKYFWFD